MAIDDIKPFFIACLFFVMATSSHAQNSVIEGKMQCTVKSQQIQKIDEGRATTYNNFKDGVKIEGKIDFTYRQEDGNWLVSLGGSEGLNQIAYIASHHKKHLWPREKLHQSDGIFVVYESPLGEFGVFHRDIIRLQVRDGQTTSLVLKRYYKEDWHGVFSSINTDLISWVFTMDCRQKTNRLEAAIKDAFSYTQ